MKNLQATATAAEADRAERPWTTWPKVPVFWYVWTIPWYIRKKSWNDGVFHPFVPRKKLKKHMKTLKWSGNIVNIPTCLGTKGPGRQFFSRQGGGCSTLLVVGGLPEQIGSTLVGDARWIVSTVSLRKCVGLISSHLWGKHRKSMHGWRNI